jgi:hypothetical protein
MIGIDVINCCVTGMGDKISALDILIVMDNAKCPLSSHSLTGSVG